MGYFQTGFLNRLLEGLLRWFAMKGFLDRLLIWAFLKGFSDVAYQTGLSHRLLIPASQIGPLSDRLLRRASQTGISEGFLRQTSRMGFSDRLLILVSDSLSDRISDRL